MNHIRPLPVLGVAVLLAACGGESGTDPRDSGPTPGTLDFDSDLVNLFETRSTAFVLVNGTSETITGVSFGVGSTFDDRGIDVGGVQGTAIPPQAPSIPPGGQVSVSASLRVTGLPTGEYETIFEARVNGEPRASLRLAFDVLAGSPTSAVSVEIVEGPTSLRQGDPVEYRGEAPNSRGELLPPGFIEWFILPTDAGLLEQTGAFVPFRTGPAVLVARSGIHFDSLDIDIQPRGVTGSLEVVGRGSGSGALDVSVSGSTAWVGTDGGTVQGWDVSAPSAPLAAGTLALDASAVRAVHLRADGTLGAAGHSGSEDGANGVTLFDPTDPASPEFLARFTDGLEAGVTDVHLEGDLLFAVETGGGVRIVDVSDPTTPVGLSTFQGATSHARTVRVRDGILYVAHWNGGAWAVDVGNGVEEGSPENPVEIAAIIPGGGQVGHVALLPEQGLILLSEVDASTPGVVHMMTLPDEGASSEVGQWGVDGIPPGPLAVHDSGERIVGAWGPGGVRLLDSSGELLGAMQRQGRELAVSLYDGAATDAVAVEIVGDLVYVADAAAGLVILRIG